MAEAEAGKEKTPSLLARLLSKYYANFCLEIISFNYRPGTVNPKQ